jgi:tetratricopeptide (TPR) repeat protein
MAPDRRGITRAAVLALLAPGFAGLVAAQAETVPLKKTVANLLLAERPAEALALIVAARERAPKDPELPIYAGEAHFQLEEYEKSVAAFREAIRIDAAVTPYIQNLGHALIKLRRLEEARTHFAIVAERGPNPSARARGLAGLGLAHAENGDLPAARARFSEALAIDPGLLRARYQLAVIQLKAGEHAAAIEHLRAVVAVDPLYEGAAYNLFLGYVAAKDESAAKEWERRFKEVRKAKRELEDLKGALRTDQGNADLMLAIARVYAREHATADAVSWYQRCLDVRPADAAARRELDEVRQHAAASRPKGP